MVEADVLTTDYCCSRQDRWMMTIATVQCIILPTHSPLTHHSLTTHHSLATHSPLTHPPLTHALTDPPTHTSTHSYTPMRNQQEQQQQQDMKWKDIKKIDTWEGLIISTRWPRRPNPVTSVQAVAPLPFSIRAASALLSCMLSKAPALS